MRQGWQWRTTSAARKQLDRLDSQRRKQVIEKLDDLAAGAPNLDIEKLGGDRGYRLRVGSFRIVFTVESEDQTFLITKIGDRKDIYR